jgi:uncharacterized sporulation protein YeaH/YhbH (DUF444 family)
MAHIIIDRRKNDSGKSTVNRQRFVRHNKPLMKKAVHDIIGDRDMKDITSDSTKKVRISNKGSKQPTFRHSSSGGRSDQVYPGNDRFVQGDRLHRPDSKDNDDGSSASPDGESMDEFVFQISQDEFMDFMFDGLELPDLVKKDMSTVDNWTMHRAGFSSDGNPSRLNLLRSMKQSKGRRLALRTPKRKKIEELQLELRDLLIFIEHGPDKDNTYELKRQVEIEQEIAKLLKKMNAVPFMDDSDLRYNRWDKISNPTTKAVMFCIMDVSGSMQKWEKNMAKRFYILLYMFLLRTYKKVDVVFIRHHTVAKEVDEQEFFYSKESGGTLMSPALELTMDIIKDRYPLNDWNIFGCQASDGDNWDEDSIITRDILIDQLLPMMQYYAYVELNEDNNRESDISQYYKTVKDTANNFEMAIISNVTDIFPVFRGLFDKQSRKT